MAVLTAAPIGVNWEASWDTNTWAQGVWLGAGGGSGSGANVNRRTVPAVSQYWRAPGIYPTAEKPLWWRIVAGRSYPLFTYRDGEDPDIPPPPDSVPPITPVYIIDKTYCFNRRKPRETATCLRRPSEAITALRRPPPCPDKYACPQSGCV